MIDYENFLLRMFMIGYEKRNVGLAVSYYKICGDIAETKQRQLLYVRQRETLKAQWALEM